MRRYIVEHAGELADIISRNNGKTRIDALSTEVIPAALAATYYGRAARRLFRRRHLRPGTLFFANKRSYVDRVPWGVVGIISPWNYPFGIPLHEVFMGLIAGNAVVLKAATQTQEVARAIGRVVGAGELPAGVFHLLNVPGAIAGDAFIDAGVNKLFFTGSVAVGKTLMRKAAEKLIPVSLELGGNDPMIVCADADLVRAAEGAAWGGYSNAGQSCGGVERIYVERPVYDDFVRLLRARVETLTQGPGTDDEVQVGAMTTEKQLRTVVDHVQDALDKGARITAVAKDLRPQASGWFYPPTVLENVTDDMLTMREETFGPVVAVSPVESIDEAIRRANDSTLGLTASVWTRRRKRAHAIAARLEAGAVTINDHLMSHGLAETPWGGFKESGIGRTHGMLGLEEMTQPRVVVDDVLPGVRRDLWWYPHSHTLYLGLLGFLNTLYGLTLGSRVRGMLHLLRTLPRMFQR
jgi:succinate-semialdehyde dehydrogenase/glutarate-semialdehyde dehydrogenase